MKKNGMRVLALLLCTVMVLGMLPAFSLPVRAAQRTAAETVPHDGFDYFEDNFDSYTGSALEAGEYYSFGSGAPALKNVDGRGKVLDITLNAGGSFAAYALDVKAAQMNRILSFDVKFDANSLGSWGGIYAKPTYEKVGSAENQLYTVLSNSNSASMKPGVTLKSGQESTLNGFGNKAFTFDPAVWYSVKIGNLGNALAVKVWSVNESEPAEWTVAAFSSYTPTNDSADVRLEFVVTDSNSANFLIDNLCIQYAGIEDTFDQYTAGAFAGSDLYSNNLGDIVAVENRGNVLEVTADATNPSLVMPVGMADKVVTFDLQYVSGSFGNASGLFPKVATWTDGNGTDQGLYVTLTNGSWIPNGFRLSSGYGSESGGFGTVHTPLNYAMGTWYTVKMMLEGADYYVKAWPANETEPEAWNATGTTGLAPGDADTNVELQFVNLGGAMTMRVDNLKVDAIPVEPAEDDDDDTVTYLEDVENMPGIAFTNAEKQPELVEEMDARENVLKLDEAGTRVALISDCVSKSVTFDFKYTGAFTSYYGIYFNTYADSNGNGIGGSILPAYSQNLMTNLYDPALRQNGTAAAISADTWYTCNVKQDGRSLSFTVQKADGTGSVYSISSDVLDTFSMPTTGDCDFTIKLELNTNDSAVLYLDNLYMDPPTEVPDELYLEDVNGMPGLLFADESMQPELVASKNGRKSVLKFVENKDFLEILSDSAEKTVSFDFMYEGAYTQWYGIYFYAYDHETAAATNIGGSILPAFSSNLMIDSYRNGSYMGGRTEGTATVTANTWYTCTAVLDGRTFTLTVEKADGTGTAYTITQNLPGDFPEISDDKNCNFYLKHELNTNDNAVLYVDNLYTDCPAEIPDEPVEVEITVSYDSEIMDVAGAGTYTTGDEVTLTAAVKDTYAGIYGFNGWTKNGTLVSSNATYTFTAKNDGEYVATFKTLTDEPGYTYFVDDYESYEIGPANKNTMPANYISFAEVGRYQITADPLNPDNQTFFGVTNTVNNTNLMNMDCEIIDKEICFDFLYDSAFNSYGGIYTKLHCQQAENGETDGYYFSINPDFGTSNIIISCNEGNLGSTSYDFDPDTWYSVKSRLVDNQIFVKVWPKGSEEPANWNISHELSGFTPVADGSWFGFELFNFQAGEVGVYIDNMVMKTWRQLAQKAQYTVAVNSEDTNMGTVSGNGTYLDGNLARVTATPVRGYSFVNWTDGEGNVVSEDANYSFTVTANITLTANFEETPVVIRSFMAEGLTQVAEIDEENRTVTLRFASDIDLTNVYPYFYLDAGVEVQQDSYTRMDLSQPVVLGMGDSKWTITATQNGVMAEFFVDPRWGDDANSGTSSGDAFATLEAARDAVRAIDGWSGDVIIHLAKGEYTLTETLELGLQDSADRGYAVIWQGTGDANEVVINSAQHLDGVWTESTDVPGLASGLVAWEYDAAGLTYSRDLYVDGEMATLAGFVTDESAVGTWGHTDVSYMTKTDTGYEVSGILADMYAWHNPTDIEFVYEVGWTYSILPITSIVQSGSGSTVTMKNDAYRAACTKAGVQITDPSSIINCFEGLDTAGEWYFDRAANKIYYITDGADPNDMDCVIPSLDQLVTVRGEGGSNAQWVYGVTFKDITFQYTSYLRPHTYGQAEIQASYIVDLDSLNWAYYHQHDYFKKTDGGVIASYTECMRVSGCIFTNMSASAMDFEIGCLGSQFVGNNITNVGAGGVSVGGVSVRDAQPFNNMAYVNGVLQEVGADPNRVTQYTLVLSNYLDGIGLSYKGSVGIIAGHVADVTIAHNTITNASYSGVSAGWGWGAWDGGGNSRPDTNYHKFPETASIQARYVIENNNISGVCQRLADGGAVYTLSLMPGSQLNGNVMHDNPTIFGGVYFDECTGGFTSISDNIIYDVHTIYNYHLQGGFTDRQAAMRELMYGGTNYLGIGPDSEAADDRYEAIFENSGYLPGDTGLMPPAINPVNFLTPAEEVEALIEALPEAEDITLEDAADVAEAREMFDALSAEEQALVSNEDKLIAAEEAIEELLNAENVEELIEELPAAEDVTLEDLETILAARAAYDALSDEEKELVGNLDDLTAAEEALAPYINAAEAEELMEALPDPALTETDDEDAVEALAEAKAAYDALTDAEKALVSEDAVAAMEALAAKLSDYNFTSGDGSVVNTENYRDLLFVTNGAFSKFEGIEVDGTAVSAENYTAEAGSTHITLKADYLGTLSAGKHTLTAVYTDGETECEFEIKATSTDGDGSDGGTTDPGAGNGSGTGSGTGSNTGSNAGTTGGSTNTGTGSGPNTGDHSNLTMWLGLMLLASAVAVLLFGFALKKAKPAKH